MEPSLVVEAHEVLGRGNYYVVTLVQGCDGMHPLTGSVLTTLQALSIAQGPASLSYRVSTFDAVMRAHN